MTFTDVYKAMQEFQSRHNASPSAIEMSRETLNLWAKETATMPSNSSSETLYGIPLVFDEFVPLNSYRVLP